MEKRFEQERLSVKFDPYPFERLTALLDGIEPSSRYEATVMTIGEPQFETPDFIQSALRESADLLKKYPKTAGERYLKKSQLNFIKNRFGVELKESELIPTFGTREVLFNFPQFLLFDIQNPVMAFTSPFYQIYKGAAKASRAEIIYLNLTKESDFKPDIKDERLKNANLVILNSPNNPTASVLSKKELGEWVKLALEYDFVLLNDECYSEIYCDKPDSSLLEACIKVGNSSFKNTLVLNSISKRSSAPGLRSGFVAGDEGILKEYMKYRTYVGCAVPLPLQFASAKAWSDEEHVKEARKRYKRNFELAKEILGVKTPNSTFYIWLEVEDDLEFTKLLYKEKNLKVIPGTFLSRGDFKTKHVRIALVEDEENTKEAILRIKELL